MRTNEAAYNLNDFDEPYVQQKKSKATSIRMKEKNELATNRKSYVVFLLVVAYILALSTILLCANAKLTEVSNDLSKQQTVLESAKTANSSLALSVENMISLKSIEEIALNELGMIEAPNTQVRYVSLKNGNKAEVLVEDNSIVSKIVGIYEKIKEYIL